MEFHIDLVDALPDLGAVTEAILALDPAALVDLDPLQRVLRVAGSLDATELVSLIERSGYPLQAHQVTQLPSVCCGGCGG